ncbi:MAG: PP2C family protein-serine/threonine phosphatase [Lachnospiraceae bacterium]|nr:PP2C family protein-serine/threonine phosphatase [Lachnospiraceae bacterium]
MDAKVIILWAFAVFLSALFAEIIAASTLKPKVKKWQLILAWLLATVGSFLLNLISYSIRLDNDFVSTVGQCVLLCLVLIPLYKETIPEKLFVGMTASLLSNVATFMFCGTTDSFIAVKYNLIDPDFGPYNTANILVFMGIKVVVFVILYFLYMRFLRERLVEILSLAEEQMKNYLAGPAVSILGFYMVNLVTNKTGIFPGTVWFFPLYLSICVIFIAEYLQTFVSIHWTAAARKSEAEKERIGADLKVATQIQADMLPSIFPAFPGRPEFDIFATMDPAKEVGGDFYDFFLVDDDHLALVIADVSGKGVPAALFMVIAKTLIKNRLQMGEDPAEALANVNDQLCEGNEAQLFVTVWLAVIDLVTGHALEINAGHEKPAIRRKGGQFELIKTKHSPAVATLEGMHFRQTEFDLYPGDTLYVYTDGVPEATNTADELYTVDRMLEALNADPDVEPKTLLSNVKVAIDAFVGEADQFDDITMLGLKYFGKEGRDA